MERMKRENPAVLREYYSAVNQKRRDRVKSERSHIQRVEADSRPGLSVEALLRGGLTWQRLGEENPELYKLNARIANAREREYMRQKYPVQYYKKAVGGRYAWTQARFSIIKQTDPERWRIIREKKNEYERARRLRLKLKNPKSPQRSLSYYQSILRKERAEANKALQQSAAQDVARPRRSRLMVHREKSTGAFKATVEEFTPTDSEPRHSSHEQKQGNGQDLERGLTATSGSKRKHSTIEDLGKSLAPSSEAKRRKISSEVSSSSYSGASELGKMIQTWREDLPGGAPHTPTQHAEKLTKASASNFAMKSPEQQENIAKESGKILVQKAIKTIQVPKMKVPNISRISPKQQQKGPDAKAEFERIIQVLQQEHPELSRAAILRAQELMEQKQEKKALDAKDGYQQTIEMPQKQEHPEKSRGASLRAEHMMKQMDTERPETSRAAAQRAETLMKQNERKRPASPRMAALRTERAMQRSDRESRKGVHLKSQVSEEESHGRSSTSTGRSSSVGESQSVDSELKEFGEIVKLWHAYPQSVDRPQSVDKSSSMDKSQSVDRSQSKSSDKEQREWDEIAKMWHQR